MPLYAIDGSKMQASRAGDVITFTKASGSDTNLAPPLDAAQRDRLMIRIYRNQRLMMREMGIEDDDNG